MAGAIGIFNTHPGDIRDEHDRYCRRVIATLPEKR